MNNSNTWKWVTLILVALLITTGCFLAGGALGGIIGYSLGRTSARRSFAPPSFERPETPYRPEPPTPGIKRPWLGVYFQMTDEGAEIMDVIQGSPADDAGVEVGDVITAVDGETVTESQPLDVLIGRYAPGDRVRLTILREGEEKTVRVRLGTRPLQLPFDEDDPPFIIPPSPGEG
ncbi:MAG: S1C family serine protease [Anaerolineae bacterium]